MVNIDKLRGKIVEKRMNVTLLAHKMGISEDTLYRRINDGGYTFTIKEVDQIVKALNLSTREAMEIFFSDYVA